MGGQVASVATVTVRAAPAKAESGTAVARQSAARASAMAATRDLFMPSSY
jgi:hypothetical protein